MCPRRSLSPESNGCQVRIDFVGHGLIGKHIYFNFVPAAYACYAFHSQTQGQRECLQTSGAAIVPGDPSLEIRSPLAPKRAFLYVFLGSCASTQTETPLT